MNRPTKGTRNACCLAAVSALSLATSAYALDLTENFTIDPNWNGINNRMDPQNYGWSNTDNTGSTVNPPGGVASGAGEIGGVIERLNAPTDDPAGFENSYSVTIEDLNLFAPLSVRGVIHLVAPDGGSGVNVGFFNSDDYYGVDGDPHNFIGMLLDDGFNPFVSVAATGSPNRSDAPASLNLPTGVTVPFSMSYDPSVGDFGVLTLMIDGAYHFHNLDSTRGDVGTLNRFGLFAVSANGASSELYLDDLTLKNEVIVPDPTWGFDRSGDWNVSDNWVGGIPNAVDAEANFLGAITLPQTVFADTGITLGSIVFDEANTYVIGGTGSLTMDVSTGSAQISVVEGSPKINLPLFLNDNTVADVSAGATLIVGDPLTLVGGSTLTKNGEGAMDLISLVNSAAPTSLNTTAGTVNVHFDLGTNFTVNAGGGTTTFHSTQHVAAVNVGAGAAVTVAPGGNKVLVTSSAALAGTGLIDLNDNDAIIDYTGPVGTLVEDVRGHLNAGRLTSSAATPGTTRLGYADNAVLGLASFAGETVDSSSLLIKFTFAGDADLNGQVDVADLGKLASNWQTAGPWTSGDFDYSGFVDVADLGLLASNWQNGVGNPLGPSLQEALAALGLPSAAVPEPASFAVLTLAAAALATRRVRRC
jgi:hypothetical protein